MLYSYFYYSLVPSPSEIGFKYSSEIITSLFYGTYHILPNTYLFCTRLFCAISYPVDTPITPKPEQLTTLNCGCLFGPSLLM